MNFKFFKKKWFLFLILIAIIIAILLYFQSKKSNKNGYETYQITTKDLQQTITASGEITAATQVNLKFQTSGQLAWVGVKKGDYVQKWQAIASLDQRQLEKNLTQQLIDYSTTRIDFDNNINQNQSQINYRDYLNIGTIDDQDEALKILLQKSQYGLDKSVLDVEIAEISRQYAHLYSPIEGIVTEATDVNPGVNISAPSTQYTIIDPTSLRFSTQVEESDIGQIQEGMAAIINLDAFPEEKVNSIVSDIEFTATQNASGNTAFIVNLPLNTQNKYRLSMNGDVEFIVSQKFNAITIPINAVEEVDTQKFVTIKKSDGSIEKIEITTGIETDDDYEVLSGLNVGDTITILK